MRAPRRKRPPASLPADLKRRLRSTHVLKCGVCKGKPVYEDDVLVLQQVGDDEWWAGFHPRPGELRILYSHGKILYADTAEQCREALQVFLATQGYPITIHLRDV